MLQIMITLPGALFSWMDLPTLNHRVTCRLHAQPVFELWLTLAVPAWHECSAFALHIHSEFRKLKL